MNFILARKMDINSMFRLPICHDECEEDGVTMLSFLMSHDA